MVGWKFAATPTDAGTFEVVAVNSTTSLTLDRPYEGDTIEGVNYTLRDPYLVCPKDLDRWIALTFEAGGRVLETIDIPYKSMIWPKPLSWGAILVATAQEPSKAAVYSAGTVQIAVGSTTVTLSGGTWPEWCKEHLIQFGYESALYRISSRTSDLVVVLDRPYGGKGAGSDISYQLDPAGSMRLEVMGQHKDPYYIKLTYFAVPREPVNETDDIEGPDSYVRAICSEVIGRLLPRFAGANLTEQASQQLMAQAADARRWAQAMRDSLMDGRPEPAQEACMRIYYRR